MKWNEIFSETDRILKIPAPIVVEHAKTWKEKGYYRIADIGCGTGRHVISLAQMGFFVEACDPSDAAIDQTSEIVEQTKLDKQCSVSKITKNTLPIKSGVCDAAICISSIHHGVLKDIKEMMTEVKRILAPHGELLIVVPSYEHPTYGSGTEIEADTYVTDLGVDAGVPHHFFSENSLSKLISNSGFSLLKILKIEASHIAGLNDGHLMALSNVK